MTAEATALDVHLVAFGQTDVGLERKNNEDAFIIDESCGFFAVCDGMGGHASGELASRLATETMASFIESDIRQPDFRWPFHAPETASIEAQILDNAVKLANRTVFDAARGNPRHKGMGTTVVGLLAAGNKVSCVHVGDSRLYRLRDGVLEQLTEDHSLLNHYKRTRDLTEEQERNFKGKNVIVRAVGLKDSVQPELADIALLAGDVLLLCTDGLTDLVSDDLVQEQMEVGLLDLEQAVRALVRAALTRGGKDNVTVLMLRAERGQGGTQRALSSGSSLEDTSPGFDLSEGDGAWDLETLPAFEASPLMTGLLQRSGAPDLSNVPQGQASQEGLDSKGETIPPPPGVTTPQAPAPSEPAATQSGSNQDSKGRDIPPPPRIDTRRSSRGRSTRVPAPESPFANKSGAAPRPISGGTNPLDADTDQFGSDQSPGDWPTAPYRAPGKSEAESAHDEPTDTDVTDIFRAPTEQVRAIPLPPGKKD